jgi:phosphoserine phosphatase
VVLGTSQYIVDYGKKMKKIAILDWDGTLRRGFTIADWCKYLCGRGLLRLVVLEQLGTQFEAYSTGTMSHDELAFASAEIVANGLRGLSVEEVAAATKGFIDTDQGSIFRFGIDALSNLAQLGYSAYLVSGAPGSVVKSYTFPVELPLDFHCLEFISASGIYTGGLVSNPGISSIKKTIVDDIMSHIEKGRFVVAVGNSESDLPLFQYADVGLVIDNKDLSHCCTTRHTSSDESWPSIVSDLMRMGVRL